MYTGNELQSMLLNKGLTHFWSGAIFVPATGLENIATSTTQFIKNKYIIPIKPEPSPLFSLKEIDSCINKLNLLINKNDNDREQREVLDKYYNIINARISTREEKQHSITKLSQSIRGTKHKLSTREYLTRALSFNKSFSIEEQYEMYEEALIQMYGY